jgi:Asp-tRNA(Asn)/Glu-tRNA(Gln) amidotransferase A subunit family amidase
MSDLAFLSLSEAAERLRAGKLSPVTYAAALLDRIQRLDPRFHAFIRVTPEIAMAAAHQAERELRQGKWLGPLHGMPFALKDIIDWSGLPTTAHSKLLADNIATGDAAVSQRLKAAGGVLMGKLATHEFAIGGPSFDLPWPPARQSLGWQTFSRWLLERIGRGAGPRANSGRARHRHRRLGAQSRLHVRNRRHEANLWAGEPSRGLAARQLP